ncbi:hypothetical protein HSEST_3100 (plasmid) [Halapricum desulfuricans]|uniref:Uncharacterized protein n=1 Tax=Halapricum desulfuricans TaxID=2841257 RepID=A0A897NVA2_9EURY|nr:hypothetical protein HSEST_3100 [Halapricum desulfuricans]
MISQILDLDVDIGEDIDFPTDIEAVVDALLDGCDEWPELPSRTRAYACSSRRTRR